MKQTIFLIDILFVKVIYNILTNYIIQLLRTSVNKKQNNENKHEKQIKIIDTTQIELIVKLLKHSEHYYMYIPKTKEKKQWNINFQSKTVHRRHAATVLTYLNQGNVWIVRSKETDNNKGTKLKNKHSYNSRITK